MVLSDSPTASKDSIWQFFAAAASKEWSCKMIDIKSVFLQRGFSQDIFVKPPQEAEVTEGIVRELR